MMRRPVEPMLTEYLHTKASRLGIPLNGTFELTPLCNMNCRMCYVRMDREQQESIAPLRTAEEWLELGRTAKERGMTYLLLTGGRAVSAAGFPTDHAGAAQDGICHEYQLQRDADR